MLEKTFCSSPWFHIRIDSGGNYLPCRWAAWSEINTPKHNNISNTSLIGYMNSEVMNAVRTKMLNAVPMKLCDYCYNDEKNNRVSGRQKQLLKSVITLDQFQNTLCASPHYEDFRYSDINYGRTQTTPVDLQIEIGNTCNSACIMCAPKHSSKLVKDYEKLHHLDQTLFPIYQIGKNWTDDKKLIEKFVREIGELNNIKYIHFLGGETLYIKSFYDICNQLIKTGQSKTISLGTTTNCTVANADLENIIRNFQHVHLGLSVESFHKVNDYVRYPGDINDITRNINTFLKLREETDLHLALRITPNILTIYHIDTVFEFMLENKITAESCNFLQDPKCLRIEYLPIDLVNDIRSKIDLIINKYNLKETNQTIINERRKDLIDPVINQLIFEYKHLLDKLVEPDDADSQRKDLIKFLKSFESIRKNNILTYLPEYEEFLRSYGY